MPRSISRRSEQSVRAFRSVGSDPITRGEGSKVYDVDGNEYIDYVSSYGPLILGHRYPQVVKLSGMFKLRH